MNLEQAREESHWAIANKLLNSVAKDLELRGFELWSENQIGVAELKSSYKLNELYFCRKNSNVVGLVFIQELDELFWPEIDIGESLFFHKLAVLPEYQGNGFGYEILDKIVEEAINRGKLWLRLDCDNRAGLKKYYEVYGFNMVDEKQVDGFNVVRYELLAKKSERLV